MSDSQSTKTPHVHAELIKAWADGAEIQYKYITEDDTKWRDTLYPDWSQSTQYRIKPEKKPDIHMYYNATFYPDRKFADIKDCKYHLHLPPTLKLTFDGDSGQLIAAEVIE